MPDDKTPFIDSPWMQLGVPLAATIASAVAPRHASRTAAIGLAAFNGINDQRYQQKRLAALMGKDQAKADEDAADTAAFDTDINTYGTGSDDNSPEPEQDDKAPAGGPAPASTAVAHESGLLAGNPKVPKAGFKLSPQDEIGARAAFQIDKKAGLKFIEDRRKEWEDSQNVHRDSHFSDTTTEGQQATIELTRDGREVWHDKGRAPVTNMKDAYAFGTDEEKAKVAAGIEAENALKPVDWQAKGGYGFNPRTNEYAPTRPAGRGIPQPAPAAPPAQAPPPQRLGSGTMNQPQPAPAPTRAAQAPAAQGGLPAYGAPESQSDPEKIAFSRAMQEWASTHQDAGAVERQQAAAFLKRGINTDDLDRLADMVWKGEPDALIDIGKALGRGSDVRSYIYGRAARLAAQNGVKFDERGVDRKIKIIAEYSDPNSGPGKAVQSYNTALVHAGHAVDAFRKLGRNSPPVLNMPINKFLTEYAGSEQYVALSTALSVVPYEYMTFLKKGRALDQNDITKADSLISPNMNVEQGLTALRGLGQVMADQMGQSNHMYKRTVGTDIPDAFSEQTRVAAKTLGVNLHGDEPIGGGPVGVGPGDAGPKRNAPPGQPRVKENRSAAPAGEKPYRYVTNDQGVTLRSNGGPWEPVQ